MTLTVEEEFDTKMEIALCGAAFRKIFGAFVILFTLIEFNDTSIRLLLIEEPESLLYPALLQQFFILFLQDIHQGKVQAIVTSNSSGIQELFSPQVINS